MANKWNCIPGLVVFYNLYCHIVISINMHPAMAEHYCKHTQIALKDLVDYLDARK